MLRASPCVCAQKFMGVKRRRLAREAVEAKVAAENEQWAFGVVARAVMVLPRLAMHALPSFCACACACAWLLLLWPVCCQRWYVQCTWQPGRLYVGACAQKFLGAKRRRQAREALQLRMQQEAEEADNDDDVATATLGLFRALLQFF